MACRHNILSIRILWWIFCLVHSFPTIFGKLNKALLVSMDGFRHDYVEMVKSHGGHMPNFDRMIREGVTMHHMDSTYLTNTFPSHYSMATGLYEESHGIVANPMYDPDCDCVFTRSSTEAFWWDGGEPIWVTAVKAGLKTGTFFWPGSEGEHPGITLDRCMSYNKSTPFEDRIQAVISWLSVEEFDFAVTYFHEPDMTGHQLGPDNPSMVPVIENMDRILGLLLDGLNEAGLENKVNIILVSDHGMAPVDLQNQVVDVTDYVNSTILKEMVNEGTSSHMIPMPGKAVDLVEALSDIPGIHVVLKKDIPDRFHYKHNKRIMDVFAYTDEGWIITANKTKWQSMAAKACHGYDNAFLSMKSIFIAKGPDFKVGVKVNPIQSVDIYPLLCHLLKLDPAPNNGSLQRVAPMLTKAVCNTAT